MVVEVKKIISMLDMDMAVESELVEDMDVEDEDEDIEYGGEYGVIVMPMLSDVRKDKKIQWIKMQCCYRFLGL